MKLYRTALIKTTILASSCFAFFGCTDGDYDLSNVDTTIGVGGTGINLPGGNSTNAIKLDDLLDIDGSDFVSIQDNGDYVISKSDNSISPTHPKVATMNVSEPTIKTFDINLMSTSGAKSRAKRLPAITKDIDINADAFSFNYQYENAPKEIADLNTADLSTSMTITLEFSTSVKNAVTKFDNLSLSFPKYITISSVTNNTTAATVGTDNRVTFLNVPTASSLKFTVNFTRLNFKDANDDASNYLNFSNSSISMKGVVNVKGKCTMNITDYTAKDYTIKTKVETGGFTIIGANGKFNPSIDFDNIGSVSLSGVPDFLSEKDVVVDIYNPQIVLNMTSDLPLQGLVEGDLVSKDAAGKQIAKVHVPQFTIRPNASTSVCICRYKSAVTGTFDEIKEVSNLSDIIRTIPNSITFNVTAKGDPSTAASIQLGHEYTVTPKYTMTAPLAFDKDARIVYRDTLDDFNDDIKDIQLGDNGYVKLTATAENKVPVNLILSAYAIDTKGDSISTNDISIDVDKTIAASKDGTTAVSTDIVVTIKQKNKTAFKRFDGIIMKMVGASGESIKGIILNATKQTLILKNINASVVGGVIVDMN